MKVYSQIQEKINKYLFQLFSLIAGASASYYTTDNYDSTTESITGTYSTGTTPSYSTNEFTTNGEPIFTDCGGRITEFQTFSSPDYLYGYYPNRAYCSWTIDIRGVSGFFIKANRFDVEYAEGCVFDYVKVVANGQERNFCGEYSDQRREKQKGKKEGGKMTPDLVNVKDDGFEDLFVLGGQATVSFTSDHLFRFSGFEFELVEADRLDIIEYHFGVSDKIFSE